MPEKTLENEIGNSKNKGLLHTNRNRQHEMIIDDERERERASDKSKN